MSSETTYGDIGPRIGAYAAVQYLDRAQPFLTIERFGQCKPLPKNKGDTQKFRRYNALALATNPLTEGVTPAGSKLTHTDVQVTVNQYGDYAIITDKIEDLHEDKVIDEAADVIGEQAAQTLETKRFHVIRAGTNVFYPGGATSRGTVNSPVTKAVLRQVSKALQRQNARKITSVLKSSVKYDTHNIEQAYIVLVHSDLESDIRDLPGFIKAADYGGEALEGEIGTFEQFRFVKSTVFASWPDAGATDTGVYESLLSNNNDVYPMIVVSKNAFACTPLRGKNNIVPTLVKAKVTDSDPLGQRSKIGWKAWDASVILNDLWLVRIEVACKK